MKRAALILTFCLSGPLHAGEPWTVDDGTGTGNHVLNDRCTGSCAEARDGAARPQLTGPKAKPQPEILDKPVDWPPSPPAPTPTAQPKDDRDPAPSQYIGHWCLSPVIVTAEHPKGARHPACANCAPPGSGKPRPVRPSTLPDCSGLIHARGKRLGEW